MVNKVFLTKMRVKSELIYWSPISSVAWLSLVSYFVYYFWLGSWVVHGFKLGPLMEKWLNNQGGQIHENPGIFMKNWGACWIPEKNSYFSIRLFKVLGKVVGWTTEAFTGWTDSWPIRSFHPITCWKSHFSWFITTDSFKQENMFCVESNLTVNWNHKFVNMP